LGAALFNAEWAEIYPELEGGLSGLREGLYSNDGANTDVNAFEVLPVDYVFAHECLFEGMVSVYVTLANNVEAEVPPDVIRPARSRALRVAPSGRPAK
jgi:hypothetical protein